MRRVEKRPDGSAAIYAAFAMDMRVVGKDDAKPLAVYPLDIRALESENRLDGIEATDKDDGDNRRALSNSPAPSPVRVSALFSAIASDSFFELMASQSLALWSASDSDSDLSVAGSPLSGLSSPANRGADKSAAFDRGLDEFDVDVNRYVDSFGKTLLHHACRFGNLQVAQCLLFHGASASAQCPQGRTPFHDAVSSRSEHTLDLLRLLYEHEPIGMAAVDVNGGHVLHLAAIHGRLDVIQWCASLRRDNRNKLAAATESEDPLDTTNPIDNRLGSHYLLSLAITSFGGRNMLHYAAYNGRLEVLKWLLDGPGNDRNTELDASAMDANGSSLLHFASMGGHLDVCQWLVLDAPGRKNIAINAPNCEGKRAIDLAKHDLIKQFLAIVGRCARPPSALRCIGADHNSLGIAWTVELEGDERLRDVLAPIQLSLEYCRKPIGLSYAAGASMLAMFVTAARSQNLLRWERVDVVIPPSATEYWLPGLDGDTEYLVRMRAMNRNGFSEYSYSSAMSGFSTTASRSLLLPVDTRLASMLHHVSFVGNLRLDVLEGRELAAVSYPRRARTSELLSMPGYPLSPRRRVSSTSCDDDRYYCVVSIGLPGRGHHAPTTLLARGQPPRRRTVPMSAPARYDISPPLPPMIPASESSSTTWRQLYCVQSRPASVQESVVCAGSLRATRHPDFSFSTTFRVPDPSLALVRIEIRCETRLSDLNVGVATLRMVDLVRGLPLKMQWLALESPAMDRPQSSISSGDTQDRGYLLVRTMFLTDGATEAATHAALASANVSRHSAFFNDATRSSEPAPISTTGSLGSATPPLYTLHGPVDAVELDEFGFRVVDPKLHFVRGKWRHRDDDKSCKSYMCYEQLRLLMDDRQTRKWERLQASAADVDGSCGGDSDEDAAACSGLFDCAAAGTEGGGNGTISEAEQFQSIKEEAQGMSWRGFPSAHRAAIYSQLAARKRRGYPLGYYARLVDKAAHTSRDPISTASARTQPNPSENDANLGKLPVNGDEMSSSARAKFLAARKQIAGDLQRTFAGNQSWINTPEGQCALGRVMEAYAMHNSAVGYCQSMTFIVGRLLCLFHHYWRRQAPNDARHQRIYPLPVASGDLNAATRVKSLSSEEEDAFWVAAVLLDDMFPTYFSSGMRGLQTDACVLEELVRTRLPQLDRHLQQLQSPHVGLLLATQWLLPVFCSGLPAHTTFRILDVVLQRGSTVIFPIAIAMLRISQPELLAEHVDCMHVFRALKARDQRLHDAALLMEVAYDESQLLLPSTIASLRARFAQE